MKAAIFEKLGLENLKIKQDAEEPKLTDHDVIIKVKMCGVNPIDPVGVNGRLVTFGGLTGADVKLNVQSLYLRQVKLIGSSRGTRGELKDLISMSKELKTKVWKRFKLDETKEALQALFAKERDGRIMLEI